MEKTTTAQRVRIDKWLWAVRLYKTRSQAADACSEGKVRANDEPVKASRIVKVGDVFMVRHQLYTLTVQVLAIIEKRVGAPLVKDYMLDLTPEEEKTKRKEVYVFNTGKRLSKTGRPTKKDRRVIDKYTGFND
jgi:ribosome-associated heat shock protein Hsp15